MDAKPLAFRKAAILVSSLDPQTADALLTQMTPDQAGLVRRAMVELGDIDPEEQNHVIGEFFRIGPLVPQDQPAGIELDGKLNSTAWSPGAPGSPAADCLPDQAPSPDARPFGFLDESHCEEAKLQAFLKGEHPQTIAVVVSHLPPDRAAGVLAGLGAALQVDVLRRLVDLDQTHPEALREVERGLQSRILEQARTERRRTAGMAAVTGIFEAADRRLQHEILANLAVHDQELAERLGQPRGTFEFDNLDQLSDAALAAIVEAADPEVALLAMAGAGTALVQRLLGQLPPAGSKTLRRSLENLGPTRLSDMDDAQQAIVRLARRLAAEGRIELPRAEAGRRPVAHERGLAAT